MYIVTNCNPVYSGVLIFRKKKEVIGISELCFSCEQAWFNGADCATYAFGRHGAFGKLKSILYPAKKMKLFEWRCEPFLILLLALWNALTIEHVAIFVVLFLVGIIIAFVHFFADQKELRN